MVALPHKFKAENYQKPLAKAILQENYKRYIYCWHRRAGKDLFGLNMMIYKAIYKRIGVYWHIFPQYNQGRNAIWQAITHEGVKYLDCIPKQLIKHIRNDRMEIELINDQFTKWLVITKSQCEVQVWLRLYLVNGQTKKLVYGQRKSFNLCLQGMEARQALTSRQKVKTITLMNSYRWQENRKTGLHKS